MKPKSMRNVSVLLTEFNKKDVKLTPDEERLVDLIMFKKKGQHLPKFKEKKGGKPSSIRTISKKRAGVYETPPTTPTRQEIPHGSSVVVHSDLAQAINNGQKEIK